MLFHHISLLTQHKAENLHFYTEILGLRFVKNTVNQENHRMRHLYYGDYQGSAGSVITFFVVPHLGHRYDNDHFLGEIGINLPKNSLAYWEKRLTTFEIPYEKIKNQIYLSDPDEVKLILTETHLAPLEKNLVVRNEILPEKQILGLRSINFHVKDPSETQNFFQQLLNWSIIEGTYTDSDHEFFNISQSQERHARSHMGRGSIDHIAFAVKDDAALDALYQKAQAQHWKIEEMVSRGYFKSLYIREPGGNRVEFATLGPGFTLDEPLEHLGETFALPPFLAAQRTEIEANLYPEK